MILATVGVVLSLASQRGPGGETKPAAGEASVSGRVRRVTAGYLRMNDPGFVVRTLEAATTPRGRVVAAGVLDPETIASRSALLTAYAPYLRGVDRSSAPVTIGGGANGTGGRPAPFDPNAPKEAPPAPATTPIKITYGDKATTLDLGTAVQNDQGAGAATAMLRGVAPRDGTLSILEANGTPIEVTRVFLYTGEIKGGVPVTESTPMLHKTGNTYAVKKGQEFAVRVRLDPRKPGAFVETINVNDGTRTISVTAKGQVAPKGGQISCWIEESDLYVLPGTPTKGVLHVRLNGNAPTEIAVTGTADFSGVVVGAKKVGAKGQDEIAIPFTLQAPDRAPNGSGTVALTATAYGGAAKATATTSGKAETVWTEWKDFTATSGNVTATGTLHYSTAGDWEYVLLAKTTSKNVNDYCVFGIFLDTPIGDGTRLGTVAGGELAAKNNPGPSSRAWKRWGYDPRLMGPKLVNSPTKGRFFVDPTGGGGSIKAPLQYWQDSNRIVRLHDGN